MEKILKNTRLPTAVENFMATGSLISAEVERQLLHRLVVNIYDLGT